MADYRLTNAARDDLYDILDYTLATFGERQAGIYVDGLRTCFDLLAGNPGLGRILDRIRSGLRRHEHGRHLIFYIDRDDYILIVRVLHRSVDPGRYPG